MRPRRLTVALAVLLAASVGGLLGPLAAGEGAGRIVSKTYVQATFVPPEVHCTYDARHVDPGDLPVDVAPVAHPVDAYQQACFPILPGETTYSLAVDDAGPFVSRGWYIFTDAEGRWMGYRSYYFCDTAEDVVPEGAATMMVVLQGAHTACGVLSAPPWVSVATSGTVTVTFR